MVKKLKKNIKNTSKRIEATKLDLEKGRGEPCNDINQANLISNNGGSSNTDSPRTKTRDKKIKQRKKQSDSVTTAPTPRPFKKAKRRSRAYNYGSNDFPSGDEKRDATAAESRKVHLKICRVQRDLVAASFDKRILSKEQRHLLDASCGIRRRYCAPMLASDLKLRKELGYGAIDEFQQLWRRAEADPELRVYHITLLSDKFQFPVRDGHAEVLATIEKCTHILRQYTDFDAYGIYEAQAITGQTNARSDETFYGHIHLIAWTRNPDDKQKLLEHTKGYAAKLTQKPILVQQLGTTEGDFTRLARYLSKPPYEAKKVNKKAYEAGKKCIKGTLKGVAKYHRLRLLELQSKLPLENSIFGVGEGVAMKNRIIRKVRDFHRNRQGQCMDIDIASIENFYEDFYDQNKGDFGNYRPMNVHYRRRRR